MLFFFISAVIVFYCRRRYRKFQLRRTALRQINSLQQRFRAGESQHKILAEVSQLLRTIAVARFPGQAVAGLTGPQWLDFLDQTQDYNARLHFQQQELIPGLLISPYNPHHRLSEPDMERLLKLARYWLAYNA